MKYVAVINTTTTTTTTATTTTTILTIVHGEMYIVAHLYLIANRYEI